MLLFNLFFPSMWLSKHPVIYNEREQNAPAPFIFRTNQRVYRCGIT